MENRFGEIIRSRQNKSVVLLSKLDDKKSREAEHLFRYDGIKLFQESCLGGIENTHVFLRESDVDRIIQRLFERGIEDIFAHADRIIVLSDEVFDKVSKEKSPEGIICIAKYIDKFHKIIKIDKRDSLSNAKIKGEIGDNERVIALESVRDPGNLGTIIRSAYALGIDRLVISRDCADIYNPKTIRAAMGSLFRMNIIVTDGLSDFLSVLRGNGRRLLAMALDRDASCFGSISLTTKDIMVIGNEGHGLSQEMISVCDKTLYIPMREGAESLNAAAAALLCIWELGRL